MRQITVGSGTRCAITQRMQDERSPDHLRRNRLTTILGNAELLQRWVERTASLSERERTVVAQQVADILQAAQDLRNDQESPPRAPEDL